MAAASSLDEHSVRGRDGHTGARTAGDIGFAALRGGTVVGDHSVIFAGPTSASSSRIRPRTAMIFARGALKAALWAQGKKPGLYSHGRRAGPRRFLKLDLRTESEDMTDRLLVLVRHGQSEWNLKNLFTGWKDPDLTEKGVEEAKAAGRKLKARGLPFDIAFTSALMRAQHTLDLMLEELGQTGLPITRTRRSTSATTAISPASTRTTRARIGARSRCMSGAAPTTCRRPAAKA